MSPFEPARTQGPGTSGWKISPCGGCGIYMGPLQPVLAGRFGSEAGPHPVLTASPGPRFGPQPDLTSIQTADPMGYRPDWATAVDTTSSVGECIMSGP